MISSGNIPIKGASIFAAARDLSSMKEELELMKRAHTKLDQRVRERTAELEWANEKLRKEIEDREDAQRAAEARAKLQGQLLRTQKMEAMGTLTGGIAHDFNNLFTVINGYAELLLSDKREDDLSSAHCQNILKTVERGAELIKRLLESTKKGESNPEPTDLNCLIQNAVAFMERTFPKVIEIETILSDNLERVNADAGQMDRLLMNLCVNAKEAMPEGGRLTIETQNTFIDEEYCPCHTGAKHGPYVLIKISDTGRGMSAETVERIFDPFFTTKELDFKKGSGLGLSVAKGIVEQHGGWITCQSELEAGTKFWIYFPAIGRTLAV